jgi:hypothetical protein
MGTLKVSVLEKDGVEYEFASEYDLEEALAYVQFIRPRIAEADIDFGLAENCFVSATVSATWVTASSVLSLTILPNVLDHDNEDALIEELKCSYGNIVDGVGFDVFIHAPNETWGRYKIKILGV